MGIDYTAVSMYGKEYESLNDALAELYEKGILSESDAWSSEGTGKIYKGGKTFLDVCCINCMCGDGYVVGAYCDSEWIYNNPVEFQLAKDEVDNALGDGCEWFQFVQIS
jgi:hypothetical protein